MTGGWRIGRIGGVEIRMDPSLVFVAGILVFEFWSEVSFRARVTGESQGLAIAAAVGGAVLFFASILAHELAHAGMSKLRRIPVAGITLWMFGGATHARIESRGPADEFLVTVVGPGTSLVLGVVFLAGWKAAGGHDGGSLVYMLGRIGEANILLGIFNLLPGFPLDGGRLLRSTLWRATGSLSRATRIAARVGQVIAGLLIASAVLVFVQRQDFLALWPALIGSILFRGASAAAADSDRRRLLESATVGQVMSPPPPTVPGSLPVEEVLHRYLMGHEGEAFPVVEEGRVVGFVSLATVRGAGPDRPVREAMAGTAGTVQANPGERLAAVTERLGDAPSGTVLVVDRGALVGVVEPEDLDRFLRGGAVSRGETAIPPRPD